MIPSKIFSGVGKKVLYLSGAMSGLPSMNYKSFMRGERALMREGFSVLNPATNAIDPKIMASGNKKRIWGAFMRQSYQQVKDADAVVAMPKGVFGSLGGWQASSGAKMEQEWARRLNKPFVQLDGMEHGGWAEQMRKAITDFGSPWQGLRKLFGKGVTKTATQQNYRKVQSWDALNPSRSSGIYAPTTKRRPVTPPTRKSIPLSEIEGMPEGGAAAKSRHSNNPYKTGTGCDEGFGSGKVGFLRKVGRALFGQADSAKVLPNAQKVFHQQREAIAKKLAPTEFLKELEYKIRTPASGQVTVRAGGSEVTFGMLGGELLPEMVTTLKAHRGQGIASYMYRIAEESTGMRISTKATKTEAGAAFVAKRRYKELQLMELRNLKSMQASTDLVKGMSTGFTTPGLAGAGTRGGSRRTPQGGN